MVADSFLIPSTLVIIESYRHLLKSARITSSPTIRAWNNPFFKLNLLNSSNLVPATLCREGIKLLDIKCKAAWQKACKANSSYLQQFVTDLKTDWIASLLVSLGNFTEEQTHIKQGWSTKFWTLSAGILYGPQPKSTAFNSSIFLGPRNMMALYTQSNFFSPMQHPWH